MARFSPMLLCASAVLGMAVVTSPAAAVITPGVHFATDASLDFDLDDRWEDTAGVTTLDFELDDSPAVTRVLPSSTLKGIKAAYDFPGGSTGNQAGALLSTTNSGTRRSFQNGPGDWSNDDVSIEVWFKPDDLTPSPTNGQIIFEDGGGTGLGFFVDNNELRLRKAGGGGNVASNISGISSEFIQAVGTYDVSAGTMELFINGASVGTDSPGGGDWSGGDPAAVGTRGGANTGGIGGGQSNTESFDGQVAIFRVYRNKILDDPEVTANYNAVVNEAPRFYGGLIELDAAQDDGVNSTWENTGTSGTTHAGGLTGATYNGSATSNLPGITASYDFDGTGGAALSSSLDALANDVDASFEMWFRPTDLSGDEILFETGGGNGVGIYLGGGSNGDSRLSGMSDSELGFSVTQNSFGSKTAFTKFDLASIGADEFIHVIGTFDISANLASLFVNGDLVATDMASSNIDDWSGGDGAGVGRINGANMGGIAGGSQGYSAFDGEVALFRTLGRAVGADEVWARYASVAIIPEPATLLVWSLLAGLGIGLGWRRRRC